MAQKCEVCKEKIATIFLGKIVGTIVKDEKGKQHCICPSCQKSLGNDKKKILEQLKK